MGAKQLTPEERRAEIGPVFRMLAAKEPEASVAGWLVAARGWDQQNAERFVRAIARFATVDLHYPEHESTPKRLHYGLDLLVAQFLQDPRNASKLPSTTTVLELMQWSHGRLPRKPDEVPS